MRHVWFMETDSHEKWPGIISCGSVSMKFLEYFDSVVSDRTVHQIRTITWESTPASHGLHRPLRALAFWGHFCCLLALAPVRQTLRRP